MPIIDYSSIHNLGKSPHTSRKKVSSSKSRTPSRSKSEAAELLASDLIPSHLHLGDFISNSDLDGPPSPSHSSTSSLILPKDPLPYTRALSPNNHARLHPPPASPSPPPRPLRNPERVNRVSTSATTSLSGKRVPFVHRKRTSIRSRADLISPPRYPPPTQPLPLPPQAPFDTPSSPPLVPSVPGDSLAVLPSNNQSLPPAPAPSSSGSSSETKTQGQQEQETGVGHSKIGAAIGPQPQAHSPPAVSFHLPTRTPTSTEMYNPPLLPLVPSNRSSPPSHKTESTGDQGQGEQTQANVGAGDSRPQQTRRPTHAFTSPFNSPLLPWSPHPSYPPTHPHSPSSQQGSTSTSNTRKQAPGHAQNSRGVGQTSIQIPARSKFKFKFPSLSPGYAPYSLPPSLPLSQIPRRVSQSQSHPQPHPASAPSYISNYSRTQPNSDSIDANDKYNTTDPQFLLKGPLETPLWGRGLGAAVPAGGMSPGHDSGVDLQQGKRRPHTYSPISPRSGGGGTGTLSGSEMSDWEDYHHRGAHWPALRAVTSSPSSTLITSSAPSPVVLNVHGGLDRSRRRHHPFHPREVPYPRSFEREVIDLDVWDTVWLRQTCKSVTFHAFGDDSLAGSPHNPIPTRVLDIGCGTGAWILECARVWKDCHFVGLDIVPLHPDLGHLSPDLAKRVTWVQANFLEGLPFQNEEFDFVHIKRIARGVPEDKWDDLFEEITRIMKPGAAFEIIEEDLMFPGKPPDMDVPSEARSISNSQTGQKGGRTAALRTQQTFAENSGGGGVGERPSFASGTLIGRYGGRSSLIRESTHSSASGGSVLGGHRESDSVVTGVGDGASLNSTSGSGGSEKGSLFTMSGSGRSSAGSAIDAPQLPPGGTHPHQWDQGVKPPEPQLILRSRSLFTSWKARATSSSTELPQVSPAAGLGVSESSGTHPHRASSPTAIATPTQKSFQRNRPYTTGSLTPSTSGSLTPSATCSLTPSTNSTSPSQPNAATPKPKLNAAAQAVLMESMPPMFEFSPLLGAPAKSGSTPNRHGLGLSIGGLVLGSKSKLSVGGRATSPGGTGNGSGEGVKPPAPSASRTGSTATVTIMNIAGSGNDNGGNVKSGPVPDVAVPGTHDGSAKFPLGSYNENTPGGLVPVVTGESVSPVPPDPRDHQLLETIYNEMHAERFVNLEPLSLLANTMGLWFKDVRTHPPIVFRFPPPCESSLYSPTDAEGRSVFYSGEGTNPVLSIRDLLLGRSPYASLDDARLIAFPPAVGSSANLRPTSNINTHTLLDEEEWPTSPSSAQAANTASPTSPTSSSLRPRMPNSTLEIDLRTLNLHLTLRVKEILTCAEAMWDWVVDFQARTRGVEREPTEVYSVISELTRAEFDDMLVRFDLDMREHMALGSALQERFDWTINPGPTPQDKHLFDISCAKWDAYIRNINAPHQRPPSQTPSDPPSPHRHHPQGGVATTRSHPAQISQPERGTSFTSVPHPSTRLSRSLRVFVAWKP